MTMFTKPFSVVVWVGFSVVLCVVGNVPVATVVVSSVVTFGVVSGWDVVGAVGDVVADVVTAIKKI